jgi:hypothetical protein
MAEICLQGARVGALVGKLEAAGMPQHVGMRLKAELGRDAEPRHQLAYESQQGSPALRSLSRSLKIRVRLGGSPDPLGPFPEKLRGMHWRTYLRLRARAEAAEAIAFGHHAASR